MEEVCVAGKQQGSNKKGECVVERRHYGTSKKNKIKRDKRSFEENAAKGCTKRRKS